MLELRLFGSVSLTGHGQGDLAPVVAQPKRLALLAYLLLGSPRGVLHRDRIVGMFWPELTQERARAALRKSLHFLRRHLPDDAVVGEGEEHVGVRPGAIWCDAVEFRRAMVAGEYIQALELYQGDLLGGWNVAGAPDFEQWLERQRTELRQEAARAALALSEGELAEGSLRSAILWARRSMSLVPDSEGAVQWLMYLQDRAGDRAGALATYRRFERQLDLEFGLSPSPETEALSREIQQRAQGVSAVGPASRLPEAVTGRDADLYRELVEQSTDVFFRVNQHWRITFVNAAGAALLGRPPERVLGAHALRFVRQDSRRSLRDLVAAQLARRSRVLHYDVPLQRRGAEVWLGLNVQLLQREDGGLVAQGVGRDVTAQKLADGVMRQVAMVDSETGLYNRRAVLLLTHERAKLARRVRQPLLMYLAELPPREPGLAVPEGGEADPGVLLLARLLRETFRESDLLARVGPRTFVVIAPEEREDGAEVIETRFRRRLEQVNTAGREDSGLVVLTHMMRFEPGSAGTVHQHLRRGERNVHLAAIGAA